MKKSENMVVSVLLKGVKKLGQTTVDSVSRYGLYEDALDIRLSRQLNAGKSEEK